VWLRGDWALMTLHRAHRKRARFLATASLLAIGIAATGTPARAQNATWLATPGTNDFDTAANWTPATVPTGTAFFGTSNTTSLTFSSTTTTIGGWTFNTGASAYTFTNGQNLQFTGAGIVINGGSATITNNNDLVFSGTSTAGSAGITNTGSMAFFNGSTAGSATITNNNNLVFSGTSTAGSASITTNSGGQSFIEGSASGGTARFILNGTGVLDLSGLTTGGTTAGSIEGAGSVFLGSNNLAVGGNNLSTTFSGVIQDVGGFGGTGGSLTKTGTGTLTLSGANTYSGGTTVNAGTLAVSSDANLGAASGGLTFNGGTLQWGASFFSNRSITLNAGGGTFDTQANIVTLLGGISGSGGLTEVGTGTLVLGGNSTYSGATNVNGGALVAGRPGAFSSASAFNVAAGAALDLAGSNETIGSLSGAGTVTSSSSIGLATLSIGADNTSTTFSGTINDGAGGISLTKIGTGTLTLTGANTYSGGTTINAGTLAVSSDANLGAASGGLTFNGGTLQSGASFGSSRSITLNAGGGTFDTQANNGNLSGDISGSGGLTKLGTGTLQLGGNNTYFGSTNVNGGVLQATSTGGFSSASAFTVRSGAILDLNGWNETIGSLSGTGNVTNSNINLATLTTGADNTSTTFSGTISDGAGGLALTKIGTGTLTLTGSNTYSGATTINGGTLEVDGSIANSSSVTVNSGATLSGTGIVDPATTTIMSGGTLAPGNAAIPTGTLTITGNLAFQSGALYLVQVTPSAAASTNVTGTATLGGAAVNANFASGSYVAKQYTILTAGSVSGTFGATVNTNLPTGFHSSLSYDPTHAYLDLALNFTPPPPGPNFGGGLNINQQNIANTLTNFFNATGGIAMVFGALSPGGLSQAAGETATGSQQTTFNAMTQFMGVMTDPFIGGRGDGITAGSSATPFAEEIGAANAYAAQDPARSKSERDAYAAIYRKAPAMAAPFDPRWSVWAAGFGGSQTTNGNTALGSNSTTSSIAGTAVGADYVFSPRTIAGFALAGGGTGFSVANGGSGHSDLFQAGAFIRHTVGPAYISAALAYGWQDITTNRTVTAAGIDQLRAEFNANAFSGRLEGGYRFVAPWAGGIGLTPYAAAQFTTFDLPAYAEQATAGSNVFALAYNAKDVTDTRSELGIRTDKSWAMQGAILTLRSRFAWAHDFDPDRSIAATFQTLPGASFTVNGAAQAHDSALTTASVEMKWVNGWSAAATFEGEFSNVTSSYAGKGVVRYAW
jgi:autotransporter-associated beta strand protein